MVENWGTGRPDFSSYTTVSGIVGVSGEVHVVSGETTTAIVSGIVDIKTPTDILIGPSNNPQVIGAISGGVPLTSGAIMSVIVKALSINSGDIYVGGYKTGHQPYSGVGFLLEPGDAMSINIDNIGKVNLFAEVSGDKATYIGNA